MLMLTDFWAYLIASAANPAKGHDALRRLDRFDFGCIRFGPSSGWT